MCTCDGPSWVSASCFPRYVAHCCTPVLVLNSRACESWTDNHCLASGLPCVMLYDGRFSRTMHLGEF